MSQVVQTLDDFGKPAWIVATIAGFVLFWPVGLTILAFMLWSGRMHFGWHGGCGRSDNRFADKFDRARGRFEGHMRGFGRGYSSGNRAFDDYREATLKRLEEEEAEFRAFLDKLRHAKDKVEFDQFMAERRDRPAPNEATL